MNSYKSSVTLGKLRPSGGNPRKDFGDLDALAQSMLATGGAPISPIVCVADGNVYRIVDGERRWRALNKIHDDDFAVDVIVCADFSEADELVAMLATDDKMRLTPAEQARGFQSMMALGVDEERAARATRRDVEQVRRARRSLAAAEGAEQASLEALIIAGDDDFDEDERARIVRAGENDRPWETPASVAEGIRKNHRRLAKLEGLRKAMAMVTGGGDVEFVDEVTAYAPYDWRSEGLVFIAELSTAKGVVETMGKTLPKLRVSPRECVCYVDNRMHTTLQLFRRLREGEEQGPSEREAAAEKRREELARRSKLLEDVRAAVGEFLSERLDGTESARASLPMLAAACAESRREVDADRYGTDLILFPKALKSEHWDPSYYEVIAYVDGTIGSATVDDYPDGIWAPWNDGRIKAFRASYARAWDALAADGWQPPKWVAEVREACGDAPEGGDEE